ncbi:MAG: aspartate ammonia-lyase [Ignavibacteria bacterium]|jgi:aspartate ammonia-lyase|nr:aspartate ammonia-lyase [Ignavibacteria bacterium]
MDNKELYNLITNLTGIKLSGKTRTESDLIGEREVPDELYFGVQTLRGIENFQISGRTLRDFPHFINGFAYVKKAAAIANTQVGQMDKSICEAICKACDEIISGKLHENFVVDLIQGGAGTSTNMCANEVIANRALEIIGKSKGDYKTISPNDHINHAQSTNDSYPSSIHIAFLLYNKDLIASLERLVASFRTKAREFDKVIKMGRTQLQDAVPMTLGQEFNAFANTLHTEIENLNCAVSWLEYINMGATAIGTGLNCHADYPKICVSELAKMTGFDLEPSEDLIEATPDTSGFVSYHSAIKRLAIKLSKTCNDLRLLASGPRAGLAEINLPKMQPGSSIMPGKVNPVIPEVVNQVCFKVFGNETTVEFASEAAQLQLNVMEPVIVEALHESILYMVNAMDTLRTLCIDGITANADRTREMVLHNIGIVTALNPVIGYKTSTAIAKEALETGRGVYELVLEKGILDKTTLDKVLEPESMCTFNVK